MVTQLEGRKERGKTSFLPVPRSYFVTGTSYDQLLEQLDTSLQNWFALICICMVGEDNPSSILLGSVAGPEN